MGELKKINWFGPLIGGVFIGGFFGWFFAVILLSLPPAIGVRLAIFIIVLMLFWAGFYAALSDQRAALQAEQRP